MLRRTKQNRRPARRSSEDALRGYAPRMISGLQRCSRLTVSAYFSPHGGKLRTLSSGKIPISFRLYAANKSGFRFQVKALGGRVPTLEQMEPALSMKQKDWCKSPAAKSAAALMRPIPDHRRCSMVSRSWAPSFGLGSTVCFSTQAERSGLASGISNLGRDLL